DAADRAMLADRIGLMHEVPADRQQHAHSFSQEPDAAAGPAAASIEGSEQPRGQAGMQGVAAGGVDVHPIALHPIGGRAVALVDRNADTGLLEPLRQREAADAAPDDDDVAELRDVEQSVLLV